MRNHFTITISDVHGARDYSFKQVFKRFAWILLFGFLLIWGGGALTIWWLSHQASQIESQHLQAVKSYEQVLNEKKNDFIHVASEKRLLEDELAEKTRQAELLDQTLQGLEELIGTSTSAEEPERPVEERVKLVQLNTLGKSLMMEMTPNGRPVANFVGVSSSYGWRTHPVRGSKQFHRGIDYRGEKGASVIATADGVVEYAGYHKNSGFGNLIILSHSNGFKTHYGHLSRLDVKTGQLVSQGDVIGGIGSTGLSSGNHLHYEVSFVQRKLNPAPFVEWSLQNYDSIFQEVEGVPWGSLSQAVNERVKRVEKQLLRRGVSLAANSAN
ncbi:M23 family metallopeptidase [Thiomicrorhabdus chilensis]|uniref:M23 family metallopeptidase n=1 Tax=Thiomicrorhabdus chilensis TaxID=63656 RepID=UPI0003F698E3|nr:M23 family metallopeptidase [Thiomicrorhabdus chilensis]